MSVKIRLRPLKSRGVFRLEVIDSRSPRDGRAIEQIGFNDRRQSPSIMNINVDKALSWIENGAQPTIAAQSILRKTGVLYKKHLLVGCKKGAITPEQVEEKFLDWKKQHEEKIRKQREGIIAKAKEVRNELMTKEIAKKDKRAEAIMAKEKAKGEELLKIAKEANAEANEQKSE
ncbi:MAG: 30S ribosomal protein S16 [Solitalea-like symbiont of Acarus siro]